MRITRKRGIAIAGVAVLVVVGAGLAVAAPGHTERYAGKKAGAPTWTAPCWERPPRRDRRLLAPCAEVSGRVLWIRKQGGVSKSSKAQLALASNFKIVIAKMAPYDGSKLPSIGSYVHIVGPLVRSKAGFDEVQFFAER